jgi:hypothetical protein
MAGTGDDDLPHTFVKSAGHCLVEEHGPGGQEGKRRAAKHRSHDAPLVERHAG